MISLGVCLFARPLLLIFIRPEETEILSIGIQYLWIEGAFYCLIGWLFLFYGFYRAMKRPGMSVILTVISLGVRVILAYTLSAVPEIGVAGIWAAVPIGWFPGRSGGDSVLFPQEKPSFGGGRGSRERKHFEK